jgi:HD-GYP domain-containing protein (c-di-GMP phosphodiesterase class II)
MAFYGIGNLFGNLVRPETREKEQARENEGKKTEQEKAAKNEEAAKGQQAREADTAAQAEAQRQRLLQLQEKVARRLEDFVRASGREKSQSADSDTESLLRQMENEQDSFTPENLQRLRQLSQTTKGVLQASREGQSESQARQDTGRTDAGRPQPGTSQDQELLMRRAAQELKNQLQHTEAQTTGRAQQEAREAGRDTATDTRSQKAQEARSQSTTPESGAARAEKPAQPEQARTQATRPETAKPEQPKAQAAKPETAKPEQPKAQAARPEATKPEQPKAQAARPEAAKPEQPKAQAARPEAAKPEQPKAQAARPENAKPEQPKAQAARPEAAKPEQPKAQAARPENAKPEQPQAQATKPENAKLEQPKAQAPDLEEAPAREAGGKNQSEPTAPRPETMRARPQTAGKQTSEARTESKAPEGKPAEGQETTSRTQGPGTPARFATSQKSGTEARLPGQGPTQPEEGNRPGAERRAASQAETGPTVSKDATPEGPRTARGQETAGGAGVSTGGTTQEKNQARLGDSRFAPHMDPENPAHGKPSDQANRAPQGNQGQEQVSQGGKNAPGTGPRPEGELSGQSLGVIRPGMPEADFNRPLAGPPPGSREAEPSARQPAPPPPEPQDSLELSTPTRASRGAGLPGPAGAIGTPGNSGAVRVPTAPRVVAEKPTAGTGSPPPPAESESEGMGLRSIPAIGASPRPLPGLTPRPVGGPMAPTPQSPVAPERRPAQLQRDQVQPEMLPGASSPNVPQPVHLGAIRLPTPDGRDDSGNRKYEPTDEIGIESVDTIGRSAPPRLTPRPGLHLPVRGPQGPHPERGPVGRVEGWLPEDNPKDSTTRGRQKAADPSTSDPGIEMGTRSLPRVNTPRPPALPIFQKPEFFGPKAPRADHIHPFAPQDGLVLDDPLHPAPTHLNFKTLEDSPFRSLNQTVPETPRPERPFRPFSPLPKGDWGASRQEAVGLAAPGTDSKAPGTPAQKPLPGQTPPHIEILRPRPGGLQNRLLPGFGMDQGLLGPNLRPGPSPMATDPSGEAFQVQMAGRILSGESQFVASTAGFAGRTAGPAIPAELGSTISSATRQSGRIDPVGLMRAGLPRGPLTGGRPVISQIPIYQPVLDLIYQIRGKGKVEQESSPIKMTLSGSVGTLERQSYVPREAPSAPPGQQAATSRQNPTDAGLRPQTQPFQPAQRETVEPAQRRVHTASEQNPLLGAMTASLRGPAQSARRETAATTLVEGTQTKAETSSQRVVETGDAPGRGGGGGAGADGGERGSGGQGGQSGQGRSEGALPGNLSEMQSRFRMQNLRASAAHEAFRISMTRMQNPVGARHSEMASRYASTSIPTLLKRIYRSQDLEELDEAEAVNSLALMLKLSGEFTYDHSARVLDFAMELADELGIEDREIRHQVGLGAMFKDIGEAGLLLAQQPDEQLDEITRFMSSQDMRRASLLHDIGKIQIPRDILCKPGRMTDEEYELMKMHPIYGEQMIYPILSLRHLCPTIRGHHERWDGKGYPDGLKGEQIPLPARILAVADVFDALHAERPYKSSMEVDQVRRLLSEGKGTHFDPECVEAFLRVLDRRFPQAGRRRPQRVRAR